MIGTLLYPNTGHHTFYAASMMVAASLAILTPAIATAHDSMRGKAETKIDKPQTTAIPQDYLAVTVGKPAKPENVDPLEGDFAIWVGTVKLDGKDTLWVELIDDYGEVIYNSRIEPNETHILPDGRAIAVRSAKANLGEQKPKIKSPFPLNKSQNRVSSQKPIIVTQQAHYALDKKLQVEFIEFEESNDSQSKADHLLKVGRNLDQLWQDMIE
ncbi:hypothetical protein E1162_08670 [Rhodobacteraceae bacterium RKSG542]|uniref:hypothetical protein n=1 Tax=Pseudovibrio flavus TaxID=2529854 RepID=UPI0012BCFA07|nr:hypothetical protein [Pseudovibrio flavus]MTI17313.1 hypothetical protein [Pseudovibrio flavus]